MLNITSSVDRDKFVGHYNPYENYSRLHYDHMPVVWWVENPGYCGLYQMERLKAAFKDIEEVTEGLVRFTRANGSIIRSDIDIFCMNNGVCAGKKCDLGLTIIGSDSSVLGDVEIEIYGKQTSGRYYVHSCSDFSIHDLELFLILSAFGYKQNKDGRSIMNSLLYPDRDGCIGNGLRIDPWIVEDLKQTYRITNRS